MRRAPLRQPRLDRETTAEGLIDLFGDPLPVDFRFGFDSEPRRRHAILAASLTEGIGSPEQMNEVQKAFVSHDAQQCGFCTPGFVVACTAFVRNHPDATIDQVRAGLGGNLCRCGTYAGMMLAVVDAAKKGGS